MVRRAATLLALALIMIGPLPLVSSAPSVLRRGSIGAEVRQLQRLLNDWLTATPAARLRPLAVDGIFGPLTERAVRAYQQMHGLQVDGVVGPRTWARLLSTRIAQPPSPTRPRPTPAARPPSPTVRPTAPQPAATPSPRPTSIAGAGPCTSIPAPTNISATNPNPLCVRSNGVIQLYLKGFDTNQQYRYYIATPGGVMRGRPRVGHIGAGPLGNGLVILASGSEFGLALAPGNYVVVVEGQPAAYPRATAPFRLLP